MKKPSTKVWGLLKSPTRNSAPLPLVAAQYRHIAFPGRDRRERDSGSWQIPRPQKSESCPPRKRVKDLLARMTIDGDSSRRVPARPRPIGGGARAPRQSGGRRRRGFSYPQIPKNPEIVAHRIKFRVKGGSGIQIRLARVRRPCIRLCNADIVLFHNDTARRPSGYEKTISDCLPGG